MREGLVSSQNSTDPNKSCYLYFWKIPSCSTWSPQNIYLLIESSSQMPEAEESCLTMFWYRRRVIPNVSQPSHNIFLRDFRPCIYHNFLFYTNSLSDFLQSYLNRDLQSPLIFVSLHYSLRQGMQKRYFECADIFADWKIITSDSISIVYNCDNRVKYCYNLTYLLICDFRLFQHTVCRASIDCHELERRIVQHFKDVPVFVFLSKAHFYLFD